jgi:hypothetical protein
MVLWLFLASGCGGESAPAGDAAVTVDDAPLPADAPLPPGVQLRAHAVNIVDPEAAEEIVRYVRGQTPELYRGAEVFYRHFADSYDFLYVFSDGPVSEATASARFTPVRRPVIPGTGIARAVARPGYPMAATRLRGAVGHSLTTVGNGPTLHETLHYWSMFLNPSFGFGRDRDQNFGAHWGVAGIDGQHGGFDPTTVRCNSPAGASPPACVADSDGVVRVTVDSFGPNANRGDSVPYAPIELYLMGLVPAAEGGGPFLVFDGAHFVSADSATRRMTFEVAGFHTVSMDQIVQAHGARAPATPEERSFRAAFVLFSAAPASAARMDVARALGGHLRQRHAPRVALLV